jgi:hypothetical protein
MMTAEFGWKPSCSNSGIILAFAPELLKSRVASFLAKITSHVPAGCYTSLLSMTRSTYKGRCLKKLAVLIL